MKSFEKENSKHGQTVKNAWETKLQKQVESRQLAIKATSILQASSSLQEVVKLHKIWSILRFMPASVAVLF